MTTRLFSVFCSVALVALITACVIAPPRHEPVEYAPRVERSAIMFGNVSNIDVVPMASRPTGGGAILGAVLGAVVGSRFGSGNGRIAGAGVGAVGGAVIGNSIEEHNERNRGENEFFRVIVRFDNGGEGQFDYQRIDDLRVGDRVKIEGGQIYRV